MNPILFFKFCPVLRRLAGSDCLAVKLDLQNEEREMFPPAAESNQQMSELLLPLK